MNKSKFALVYLSIISLFFSACSQSVVVENEKNMSRPDTGNVTQSIEEKEIIKNYSFISTDPNDRSYIIPDYIEENGSILYYSGDALYEAKELMMGVSASVSESIADLDNIEAEYEYISSVTGKTYTLNKSYICSGEKEIIDRKIEERIEYGFSSSLLDVPKEKTIIYYSDISNEDEEIEATLVESGIIDEGFIGDSPIRGTFIFTDDNTYIWQLGDKEICLDKNSDKPVWDGYEQDILESLGLSGDCYKITDACWGTEEIIEGERIKKAQYSVESYGYRQYAVYEGIGKQYGYNAQILYYNDAESLDADLEDVSPIYTITITVHYVKEAPNLALLLDYKAINEDVVALISISDTVLNHPVCVSAYDEDYYLRRDLYKENNSYGVPFVAIDHSFNEPGYNNIIYGHNICKTGYDIFADIPRFGDEEYFKTHRYIRLTTEDGVSEWEIFAYCVLDETNDNFEYYNYKHFLSHKEFDWFIAEIDKRNKCDRNIEVTINDTFITLSTCSLENWGTGTNRCFIMAKKVYI